MKAVKPELTQTSVDQAFVSLQVLLCRHWWHVLSTPLSQGAAGCSSPWIPTQGRHRRCSSCFSIIHPVNKTSLCLQIIRVAGDSSLTCTQIGCTSIQSPPPEDAEHAEFSTLVVLFVLEFLLIFIQPKLCYSVHFVPDRFSFPL